MSCKKCTDFENNSCTDVVSSTCITWQGDIYDTDDLEVCIGDSLTYVENIVLSKIQDILKGKGIHLDDLDLSDCDYISDDLPDGAKKLLDILNTYKNKICELKLDLDNLSDNYTSFTDLSLYDLDCLDVIDPCSSNATFKTLIQTIITKVCSLQTQYDSIASTITDVIEEGAGDFIGSGAITSCGGTGFSISGTGAATIIKFEALVPPNCPIIYTGSLSVFDINGRGLTGTSYCNWYLCNGDNGTPNSTSLPQNDSNTIKYIIRFT